MSCTMARTWWWTTISPWSGRASPTSTTNYYVFQYATGYSAAIALSRRILREGAPAVKDYLGFLSGGCSKSPIDLLKGAGVDMTSRSL